MCFKIYEYYKSITQQVGWGGNASNLYLGGAQFESQLGTMTKVSHTFPALRHKSHDRTSNEAMTSSFHILCNSLYNTNL
jgi:hypothetical protein